MKNEYITYNHNEKKFHMSNSVFNFNTKEAKKQCNDQHYNQYFNDLFDKSYQKFKNQIKTI